MPFSKGKQQNGGGASSTKLNGDPLSAALRKDQEHESTTEREARLIREAEEKRVSDGIDKRIADEEKERKKLASKGGHSEILIVGGSNAGKSTFVRQLRALYDRKGLDAEREAVRLVILLNICSTVRTLLNLLEENVSADSAEARPLSPGGQPRSPQEALAVRRLRLAPLLGLEAPIREMLGAVNTGPSANSFAQQAVLPVDGQLEYGDPISREEVTAGTRSTSPDTRRKAQNGSRAGSPAPSDADEPILPQGYRQRIGQLAFGNGKESRRAKAQQGENGHHSVVETSKNWAADGTFVAHKDDPIHLVEALRPEVESLWDETVQRGLISGEGPLQGKLGGWEPSESARYFMDSLARIATPTWLPSDADMLNVRVRTCGIETHFLQVTPTQSYRVSDPAGARGMKHAWAPYFDGAAALIFVFDSSAYNVCDPKDPTLNRFSDALYLFEDIATNSILKNVVIIAFLNKVDILRKKIKSGHYPLDRYLPGYNGGTRSQEVLSYMQGLVEKRHPKSRKSPLYIFATQANDSKSISMVVAAVNDILMRSTLAASGLL